VGGTVEFHGCQVPRENKEDRMLGMHPVVEGARDVEMKEEDEQEEDEEEKEEQKNEDEKMEAGVGVREELQDDGEDREVDMVDAIAASI
jgi:COMPASS component SPP1